MVDSRMISFYNQHTGARLFYYEEIASRFSLTSHAWIRKQNPMHTKASRCIREQTKREVALTFVILIHDQPAVHVCAHAQHECVYFNNLQVGKGARTYRSYMTCTEQKTSL